jgi:hypothetical protein
MKQEFNYDPLDDDDESDFGEAAITMFLAGLLV